MSFLCFFLSSRYFTEGHTNVPLEAIGYLGSSGVCTVHTPLDPRGPIADTTRFSKETYSPLLFSRVGGGGAS